MVRRHLSEELIRAGQQLLAATDQLEMRAQGAMWVYDYMLEDWRYYLVTSLVDTIGRRKTYSLLLDVFEVIELPKEMTIEDVHLGSPSDPFFSMFSQVVGMGTDANSYLKFTGVEIGDVRFDGVLYRSMMSPPTVGEAVRIEKRFQKRVKDLVANDSKGSRVSVEG